MNSSSGFFKGFKNGFVEFGEVIAAVVNTALLVVVYIFGVGISSLISKIAGKEFLEKRVSKHQGSYWSELNLQKEPRDHYYRQF